MNTRRLIAFAIALPFIAGCQDGKETRQLRQEVDVLKTDAAAASNRIAALERELDDARKRQAADNQSLTTIFGRVQRVEAVLGERLYAAESATTPGYGNASAARAAESTNLSGGLRASSASARITETNDSWWRFGWQATVDNGTSQPIRVDLGIEFQDSGGFVVDTGSVPNQTIPAKGNHTFTGQALINAKVAPNVSRIVAKPRDGQSVVGSISRSVTQLPTGSPRATESLARAASPAREEVCAGCDHDPASLGRTGSDRVYINPKTKLYHRPGCSYVGPHMQAGGSYDFERMRGYKPDPNCI